MYLRDYTAAVHLQKEKHLKVIGTPVGCLSRALPSGPGTRMTWSGRLPIVPGGQIGLRRIGAIGQVEGVGDMTCVVPGGRSRLLMCAVTGFASDVRWWMGCLIDFKSGIKWWMTVRSSHVVPGHTSNPGTRKTSVGW
ncbi:hypothetical protein TIFTF001_023995 [Ficus carica]|uniref:Uncharacterized protein n=1 Tax=Ficus carica TaxID=3494 RepID=A0AA88AMM4_FICCA|nr:hypothetical protein TIFTF001_023995 [Ficus carica]